MWWVCHVLRYTPFYNAIKRIIGDGRIGEVVTIQGHGTGGLLASGAQLCARQLAPSGRIQPG